MFISVQYNFVFSEPALRRGIQLFERGASYKMTVNSYRTISSMPQGFGSRHTEISSTGRIQFPNKKPSPASMPAASYSRGPFRVPAQ